MANRKSLTDILGSNGNNFRDNWDNTAAAADFSPLPAGEYTMRALSGELFTSKRNGTPGYKVTLEVAEGEHAGRRVWAEYWLTPAALPMAKRDLKPFGIDGPDQLEKPLPAGMLFKIKLAIHRDDDGNERNRVRKVEFIGREPADAFAPKDDDAAGAEGTEAADDTPSNGRPLFPEPRFGSDRPGGGKRK
jgi:hypothetical protein